MHHSHPSLFGRYVRYIAALHHHFLLVVLVLLIEEALLDALAGLARRLAVPVHQHVVRLGLEDFGGLRCHLLLLLEMDIFLLLRRVLLGSRGADLLVEAGVCARLGAGRLVLQHTLHDLGVVRALGQILICRLDDHGAVLLGKISAQLLLRVHVLLLLLADEVVRFALALMRRSVATALPNAVLVIVVVLGGCA